MIFSNNFLNTFNNHEEVLNESISIDRDIDDFLTLFLIWDVNFLIKNDYWYRICFSSIKKDYYKWILSDKYIAKKYAQYLGFQIPHTYQLVKNPEDIYFNKLKSTDIPV